MCLTTKEKEERRNNLLIEIIKYGQDCEWDKSQNFDKDVNELFDQLKYEFDHKRYCCHGHFKDRGIPIFAKKQLATRVRTRLDDFKDMIKKNRQIKRVQKIKKLSTLKLYPRTFFKS